MSIVLTPEIVRKLCRELGGSTNGQAADVEDACRRVLDGVDIDAAIDEIRQENYECERQMAESDFESEMKG